jgi:thiamine pyrophosphokinase
VTRVAIVCAGGEPVDLRVRTKLPDAPAVVIAADSGVHQAELLGLAVDCIVGDFDSADPEAVERAVAAGAEVERHPAAKDATDLELALDAALAQEVCGIVLVGGAGGRLDHYLANVNALASGRYAGLDLVAYFGEARLAVVRGGRGPVAIDGPVGSLVTLLPIGGPARGVTTRGLEYPLRSEELPLGTTRGVSNVVQSADASVDLVDGVVFVIQPMGAVQ